MAGSEIPPEVVELAEARAAARRARDWATADAIRDRIEGAGWTVVDAGTLYTLTRSSPPDVALDGVVRYGSSRSVPSRLDDAPVGVASVVLLATDWPDDLARTLRAVVDHAPDGTQLVVVANAPSEAQASRLAELDAVDPGAPGVVTDVIWTSTRLGYAAALNAGIRRAEAPVVILLDTSVEPRGDLVSALATALADPDVAVAGPSGLVSDDLRRFDPPPTDGADVDAIAGDAIAFRRADYIARGPLDEHFVVEDGLDVWWSLVLRDQGDAPARRALPVTGEPVLRHVRHDLATMSEQEQARQAKRNFYRVLKRFATRRDLLVSGAGRDQGR